MLTFKLPSLFLARLPARMNIRSDGNEILSGRQGAQSSGGTEI
jgi:hypothetical protein